MIFTSPSDLLLPPLLCALPVAPTRLGGHGGFLPTPTRVCADSREADGHCLFVCIKGAQSDGHDYALSAYERGCRVFLVERPLKAPLPDDAHVFLSQNTLRDLALLACAVNGNPSKQLRVVGITGTKGKTSVALMCYHILKQLGISAGYIGTCGVMYGGVTYPTRNTTPGALELQSILFDMQKSGVDTVLLEVSSQALWQHRVDGICFTACAFTNLYADHIGPPEHPTLAHYAACKKRLFTEFSPAVILVNADDEAYETIVEGAYAPVRLCGFDAHAHLQATDYRMQLQNGLPASHFICPDAHSGQRVAVTLPLPGRYNVQNALLALGIVSSLGVPISEAALHLASVRIPGRFEAIPHGEALIVIDYAHNGAALRAALGALRPLTKGRLCCLFGSVGERSQCRRSDLGKAACELADYTYLTADDPGCESVQNICREIAAAFPPDKQDLYTVIVDRAEAIRTALSDLKAGDVLLIAGKGDEQAQRLGDGVHPHSDRAVVEQYTKMPL